MVVTEVQHRAASRRIIEVSAEQALAPLALLLDALLIVSVSVVSGILFHRITRGIDGDISVFAATGVIEAVLYCGMLRIYSVQKRKSDFSTVGRIAIVKTQRDELHAVLTVDTTKGDFVLDSINPVIVPWSETSYSWLSRQSAGNPLEWVSLARNF